MDRQEQARFEGWAVVDVMGHQRYVGFVTTEAYGQAVLFRVDVPALEARDRTLKSGEYVGSRWLPAGATVKEGPTQGYSKLIGSGSIYTLTPCTKEAALKAVEESQRRPLLEVSVPEGLALPPAANDFPDEFAADEDDDTDDDGTGDEDRDFDELGDGK